MSVKHSSAALLRAVSSLRYLRSVWLWIALLAILAMTSALLHRAGAKAGAGAANPGGPSSAGQHGGKFGGGPTSVAIATAEKGSLDIFIDALGTAVPINNVAVRSRVDGELTHIYFREGQQVKAGELLAEIDPRPFQVQLAQAQGKLTHDSALLQNAKLDLERYETLWSQDSISKQAVDTQLTLVHQYEGAVQSDRADVQSAELQLTYARITAPVGGRVGLRLVDPGNIVHASDSGGLLQITQLQPIAVVFAIPEERIAAIARREAAGAPLTVEIWDRQHQSKIATGKLLTFDNQIDPTTGTVKLKAIFENRGAGYAAQLFPNQFVNVRLLVDTLRDATLIPVNAVQRGSKGLFVYTLQTDQTVKQQPIQLSEAGGDSVAVINGVEPGAQLVVDGIDKLRDGAKVMVIGTGGESTPGSDKTGRKHPGAAAPPRDEVKTAQLTQRETP